jgi:TIR domain-containing protein
MSSIFVCYSRVDQHMTEHLALLLRKAYNHVWYDDNLHGGEEWWAEILKEIAACQHFIFLMSDASLNSDWCQKELHEAMLLNKHILPVLVRARTHVPDDLGRIQHIDMASGITVDGLNQLYATLIRYAREDTVAKARNKQSSTDRRLLERLWLFINGQYIELLNDQVQSGKIDWDQYTSHTRKYLDLRAKASERFSNSALEEAFEAFDDALIRLDGQIGWTYQLKEAEAGAFMIEPVTARDDSYWFEKYGRLVRRAIDVWMRHVELVETIHTVQPDFDMLKDY